MALFVLESKDGRVVHDFSFHLLEAVERINWFRMEHVHECLLSEVDNHFSRKFGHTGIPVGSIEFVLDYYKKNYCIKGIEPINIPKKLQEDRFISRKLYEKISDVPEGAKVFAKSLREFKGFTEIVEKEKLPQNKELLISEVIEIRSEWRGFVYQGKLLDMRNYSGDFRVQPNFNLVDEMIDCYTDSPKAYTLDVGITDSGETVVIEVHEFFSCGLYGFGDYENMVRMMLATHRGILDRLRVVE